MDLLNCNGRLIDLRKPTVMGILNITPDSFFDGSKYAKIDAAVAQVRKMLHDGAEIIDIGAASSRPGAPKVSEEEEWKRLTPVLAELMIQFPDLIISIDTFWASVAEKSVKAGASIINDISAFSIDHKLVDFIAESHVPYVLMHMQGNPSNMQDEPAYVDVVREIMQFFVEKLKVLEKRDIHQVIIDPGFGFGKLQEHNYEILRKLNILKLLEKPILAGLSRKSMIHKPLNISPEDALPATSALNLIALKNGAGILRVHDVKEAKQMIKIQSLLY
jgi:dihydropteroate synthase